MNEQNRILDALKKLAEGLESANTAAVAHGVIVGTLLALMSEKQLGDFLNLLSRQRQQHPPEVQAVLDGIVQLAAELQRLSREDRMDRQPS